MTSKPKSGHSDHIENLNDKQYDKLLIEIDIQFKDLLETMNFDEILRFLENLSTSAKFDDYLKKIDLDKMLSEL